MTLWPTSAKHAPVTRPTYPEPMIARSISEKRTQANQPQRKQKALKKLGIVRSLRSLSLGIRIEVQIKSKFRECFEWYGEEDPIFFHPGVIAYHSPERGHPARQIAVNGIALLLEDAGRGFILFLNSNSPVIIEPIISTDEKQAAVLEEWIVIQIAMPNIQLQVGYRLNARGRIDFRKTLGESRHLGADRKRHPGQRCKADIIKEV